MVGREMRSESYGQSRQLSFLDNIRRLLLSEPENPLSSCTKLLKTPFDCILGCGYNALFVRQVLGECFQTRRVG